ncbi:unnamed protein product [Cuscuta europaea]|uniref:Uncharacterized protein n=1 Tax=Cuscuta europaea TaxID=41803 RepID=A0A9P0YLU2_CUSEU|nr:unnamed protein product [Cuscuta europaea]
MVTSVWNLTLRASYKSWKTYNDLAEIVQVEEEEPERERLRFQTTVSSRGNNGVGPSSQLPCPKPLQAVRGEGEKDRGETKATPRHSEGHSFFNTMTMALRMRVDDADLRTMQFMSSSQC